MIGAGSIGERHIGILQKLGFSNILVYRQRLLPYRNINGDSVTTITNWNEVIHHHPFAAVICTPTHQHVQQLADCIKAGMHVLVEKPISAENIKLDFFRELLQQKQPLHVQVAYMLRYHPFSKEVMQTIETGIYGPLLRAQSYWADYLPNWHPWEDYRESYAAKKEMGGGVALTLSHDLDFMCFVAQSLPAKWYANKQYLSPLEVNVESAADFILEYPGGVCCNVHVNFFEKAARRFYRIVFEHASIEYNYLTNIATIETPGETIQREYKGFERNQMFEAQAVDFFEHCMQPDSATSLKNIEGAQAITNMCV